MKSSGYYTSEHHEHDPPFIRECDNRCGHRGTLEENWHDASKWIEGKMFKYLNPMICDKCKKEFEEADRKEMEFENNSKKLEISLTENN